MLKEITFANNNYGEEEMINNKKRNPFPMIGKVYKYEFKNLSRKIFPFFAGMILISLCIGIMSPTITFLKKDNLKVAIEKYENKDISFEEIPTLQNTATDDSEDDSLNSDVFFSSEVTENIFFILIPVFIMASMATGIFIIVFIDKRMKKGIVENEAYFNFTLPVTIGEHITGRVLTYATFFLLWGVAGMISSICCFMKYISIPFIKAIYYGFKEIYLNSPETNGILGIACLLLLLALSLFIIILLVISLQFLEKSLDMLFEKHKKLFEFIIEIPLIVLWIKIMYEIGNNVNIMNNNFTQAICIAMGVNILLMAINIAATYFILKKHINIE